MFGFRVHRYKTRIDSSQATCTLFCCCGLVQGLAHCSRSVCLSACFIPLHGKLVHFSVLLTQNHEKYCWGFQNLDFSKRLKKWRSDWTIRNKYSSINVSKKGKTSRINTYFAHFNNHSRLLGSLKYSFNKKICFLF